VLPPLQMPALTRFTDGTGPIFAGKVFPFAFITIACGAISGFHSLVASGTTPKLIDNESDARMVGYGAMLTESLVAVMALIGLAGGVLSGLFGIGGGVVIVPLLILVLGFTAQQAAGTSLAALLLPVGLFGAIQYWQAGQVNILNAALLALGLLIGAFIGARLGLSLPSEVIQRGFGVLLVVVGIRFVFFG